jgi:hypothetical protein
VSGGRLRPENPARHRASHRGSAESVRDARVVGRLSAGEGSGGGTRRTRSRTPRASRCRIRWPRCLAESVEGARVVRSNLRCPCSIRSRGLLDGGARYCVGGELAVQTSSRTERIVWSGSARAGRPVADRRAARTELSREGSADVGMAAARPPRKWMAPRTRRISPRSRMLRSKFGRVAQAPARLHGARCYWGSRRPQRSPRRGDERSRGPRLRVGARVAQLQPRARSTFPGTRGAPGEKPTEHDGAGWSQPSIRRKSSQFWTRDGQARPRIPTRCSSIDRGSIPVGRQAIERTMTTGRCPSLCMQVFYLRAFEFVVPQ